MKILVTGGSGMVGSCLKEICINNNNVFIFLSSKDGDLTSLTQTDKLFKKYRPDYVIHLAANVGGLFKNIRDKVDMFKHNVRINENVLEMCNKYNVQKGIFCLSSCIFPHKPSKYPMDESMIDESPPHPSNKGYGYSKRMMEMQCNNYNEQFGRNYICLIPVNLYGPYDNFNLKDSHVVPGLIHKFYKAKKENNIIKILGTGKPIRQFIYSYDFATIILKTLFEYNDKKSIICCNNEISIKELAILIAKIMNYNIQNISYDTSQSDGCYKKTVDGTFLKTIFPEFKYTSLENGLIKTIKWFETNYNTCRK